MYSIPLPTDYDGRLRVGLFGVARNPYVKNENPIEVVVKKEDDEESEEKEIKE